MRIILTHEIITLEDTITYNTYQETAHFYVFWWFVFLFQRVSNYGKYELNLDFFNFYFFNMDISVTRAGINLQFSVCNPNIHLEGSVKLH